MLTPTGVTKWPLRPILRQKKTVKAGVQDFVQDETITAVFRIRISVFWYLC